MLKISKRLNSIKNLIVRHKLYDIKEALLLVKKSATAKFDESIDVAINLGIDTRKSDQVIRGAVVLPNGTGKDIRIAVFTQGANVEIAKRAGVLLVGLEDLAAEVKKGNIDFDVVIATPDAMKVVGQLGTILGPRGLMPNPKVGTVTTDIETAIKNSKSGVQYRSDKGGIVHARIGRASFSEENLQQNLNAFLDAVLKAKPSSTKGQFLKNITISSTMGIGVAIDIASITLLK